MDTTINNNILNPRYYQIPQDRIEAKQSMEPLAIGTGVGPIVGFDIVDTSQTNVRITGSSSPDLNQSQRLAAWPIEQKTVKLSINGQHGVVVNGHITPSGILSVNPVWLNTGLPVSQFNNHSFLLVRASLDFTTEIENNLESIIPPGQSNFIFTRITAWTHSGLPVSSFDLLNTNYQGVLQMLGSAGITLNETKEVIVGIYEFNTPETIREQQPQFYEGMGNIIPIIPYYNIWPPRVNFDLKAHKLLEYHSGQIEWLLSNRVIEVDTPNIKDGAVTTPKVANGAINNQKLADNAVTTNKLANNSVTTAKLVDGSVNSSKLANNSVTESKILDEAVTNDKIAEDAITSSKIRDGHVTRNKIGDNQIMSNHLSSGSVGTNALSSNSVKSHIVSPGLQIDSRTGGPIGLPRALQIINNTNIYVVEVEIQGDDTIRKVVFDKLTTHVNSVTAVRFSRGSGVINDKHPTLKLYGLNLAGSWILLNTYNFINSPLNGYQTELIDLREFKTSGISSYAFYRAVVE